ncbi:MAG: cysteine--tRNA ligase [Bdellovibrionales bacterium]|nr:cysteine--tRNA ligase [Bdellovibrionales bacterium]
MTTKLNPRTIHLTNTKSHKKEVFTPLEPGKVKMYSCGPTVYGPIHIGNLRAGLTADLFYRFFKKFGFEVTYVRNYTDLDDKIIKRALEEKVDCEVITKRYTELVERDYAMAGMQEPTHKTKVTEHLPEINAMIGKIIEKGCGYVTDDGEVFFEISKFKPYGALSGKPLEDLQAGARVEVNPNKRNPMDFTLWKPAKPGEPTWDSPWSKGRPGWHIECSAMACKWLGPSMDLHHGGEDLIFPHHENEIAQSEAATGEPFVKYWVHNAFLMFSSEKMSKSLGNVVSAHDFLSQYGGEVARAIFLGVHYRSTFDFNPATVDQALTNLERMYEAKKTAEEIREKKMAVPDLKAEQVWGGFMIDCDRARNAIQDHYANDLNTAGALSEIFTLVREWNRCIKEPNAVNTPTAIIAANEFIKVMEEEIGSVIGIGRAAAPAMLAKLQAIRALRQKNEGGTVLSDAEIQTLLDERKASRAAKNFKRGDEIRDQLAAAGIEIKDSPAGTTFARK